MSQKPVFNRERWERLQVNFIAKSQLPFQILAHQDLIDLIKEASLSITMPPLLSPRTARNRLQVMVREDQERILSLLPPRAKLSIALDCWTSPFQQAFMAITGYFVDQDWNYHEILLGFLPVHGEHTGAYLSEVLLELLQQYSLIDRVIAITTDNASNNKTLVEKLDEAIQRLELPEYTQIVRIPCLAHVIQLSLKDLLGLMKAHPKNDITTTKWSEDEDETALQRAKRERGIIYTLAKVTEFVLFLFYYLCFYIHCSIGSEFCSFYQC